MALFKLVYEKKDSSGSRHLYASTTGIPADTDTEVFYDPTFTYGEGTTDKCFIYNSLTADGKQGFKVSNSRNQVPADADVQTVAYSNGVNILSGDSYTPTPTTCKVILGTLSPLHLATTGLFGVRKDETGATWTKFIENKAYTGTTEVEFPMGTALQFELELPDDKGYYTPVGMFFNDEEDVFIRDEAHRLKDTKHSPERWYEAYCTLNKNIYVYPLITLDTE